MYQLTNKALAILKKDANMRMKVAMAMGNTEQAIIKSINGDSNGKSIAEHYDAINRLLDETGLTLKDIRKEVK